jgi:hypothetical protein
LKTTGETQTVRRLRSELEGLRALEAVQRARIAELEDELRLAASLQSNLRSETPPVDGVAIHTLSCPADVVSGDMLDVVRLNESEVAITLLDATGHGLAAGILAAYVKRSLDGASLMRDTNGAPAPSEVLSGLNQHLLDLQLDECEFVTATYLVYNERNRVIRWARAGAPYPILLRPGEDSRVLPSAGPLLGVLPDAEFEVVELQLERTDTVVLHTDGLDALVSGGRHVPGESRLSSNDVLYVDRGSGFREFWEEFRGFVNASAHGRGVGDDVTVVALHVDDDVPATDDSGAQPTAAADLPNTAPV